MKITTEDWISYRENATKYLEQNSQYATRTAVQIAIDKQIPKAPVEQYMADFGDRFLACPTCGNHAIVNIYRRDRSMFPCCPMCGQRLEDINGEE